MQLRNPVIISEVLISFQVFLANNKTDHEPDFIAIYQIVTTDKENGEDCIETVKF